MKTAIILRPIERELHYYIYVVIGIKAGILPSKALCQNNKILFQKWRII